VAPPDLSRLLDTDATSQAEAVRRGDVRADELVQAAVARTQDRDARIGAVVFTRYEEALREARTATGPFAGVPIMIKDGGEEIAGCQYAIGTPVLKAIGHRSARTTPLTRALQGLGFVVIAKTNVPELSSGNTTEPSAFGPTRNPWDLTRTAGGSSGGSAAAVAGGMVAIAQGSDGTGSLRYPASACGVLTLKPSVGRIPVTIPLSDDQGLWTAFVLTRSARDLSGVYVGLVGEEPEPASSSRRVGLLDHDPMLGAPVDPACRDAVVRAGDLLEGLGHRVEAAHPRALDNLFGPIGGALDTVIADARASQLRTVERLVGRPIVEGDVDATMLEQARRQKPVTVEARDAALREIDAAMSPIVDWWDEFDLLVTPTMRQPPWLLGERTGPLHSGVFAVPFSFTGQPALSVPLHRTASGLPVGVQIVGAPGADRLLLDVAAALETASPWPTIAPAR
jgi:amidase